MSEQNLPIDPNSQYATNDITPVSNDEETRLDAPLPPSSGGPNRADDQGHVPGSDEFGRVPGDEEPGEGPL